MQGLKTHQHCIGTKAVKTVRNAGATAVLADESEHCKGSQINANTTNVHKLTKYMNKMATKLNKSPITIAQLFRVLQVTS